MKISRHSLIFGLSYALDIAGKNNLSHSKSTAFVAVSIGKELGYDKHEILELFYTGLLHDIAISNSYDMLQHSVDGKNMLQKLPLPESMAESVNYHHEYYNGTGNFGLSGDNIPLNSLIICFSSDFDDKFCPKNEKYNVDVYDTIKEWIQTKRDLYSDRIIDIFDNMIKTEAFLLNYYNHETRYTLSKNLIVYDDIYYNYEDVHKYAHCFADIIDCKSHFTRNHSNGISNLALKAAIALGYDEEIQEKMHIAGLLHDIGKLDVSPEILHKNGSLTAEERFEINKHTYYSRKILEQIEGFEDIVNYAANHHEKLDGTGYPFRIGGENLSDLERIMAVCDVYQALTEHRPYREGLSPERVWGIIDNMVKNNHLDKDLVHKLKNVFD